MESSGKCRKKVVESFEFCFVDFLFVSHFPTDQTKAVEKLLKDHAGKYATGDEVSMVIELMKFRVVDKVPLIRTIAVRTLSRFVNDSENSDILDLFLEVLPLEQNSVSV
ncbi:hypothetical protein E1A91_D11G287100v1 [Gossypium mustelinum]|uniref:Uncharacterized protein n=1 Tax=Gossypium mustelinum TaxID=34275 RepID=A0A5D2SX38_GOSMU|nr:hypothetical protein E1A91_D11G287100v1 [Gossypium mustelinum]